MIQYLIVALLDLGIERNQIEKCDLQQKRQVMPLSMSAELFPIIAN